MEILAPVGGQEQLIAAVRSGADAVYLGARGFNARRNARNFDEGSLAEAVRYCHGRSVKVYVTVNTLVTDGELPALYQTIKEISEAGADAVIVQDLAVAALFRRHCPDMPLHASTQMTLHNAEGVLQAMELGFSRVVLARELSIDEISEIYQRTGAELEVFVHGALCMCVSGQCYLSSILGGRSGNRGLCAQPCRLDFRAGRRPYALSLKDMTALSHLNELQEAGVCSLKIEGRMKRPEYVSAAVLACRDALCGKTPDFARLEAVFSRSGFTDGYLENRRNLSMFGRRTEENAASAAGVLGELAAGYRRELSRIPVDMSFSALSGCPASLSASDGTFSVHCEGAPPEAARARPSDEPFLRSILSKTGGTPFVLRNLSVHIDPGLALPASALSALRRSALEQLLTLRERPAPRPMSGSFSPPPSGGQRNAPPRIPRMRARLFSKSQWFPELDQAEKIYLPINEIDRPLIEQLGDHLVGDMPRLIFPGEEADFSRRLHLLRDMGLSSLCVHGLGGLRAGRQAGFSLYGGAGLNILNTEALTAYEQLGLQDATLSFELNLHAALSLGGRIPRGILACGRLPLMLFRACPLMGPRGCTGCGGGALTDRMGETFPVQCEDRRYSTLLNSVPLYLGDRDLSGLDFATLYFTNESADECAGLWRLFSSGKPFPGHRTNGLYYRSLK